MKLFKLLFLYFSAIVLFGCGNESTETKSKNLTIEVEDELSKLIQKEAQNPELFFKRGNIYYEQGKYKEAIEDLRQAVKLNPNNTQYNHLLADALLDNAQSRDALEILNNFVQAHPREIQSKLKLSEFQLILKQYNNSIFTLNSILRDDRLNAEAFFMLGMNFIEVGEEDKAINAFQTAVENEPELIDAWMLLGELHEKKDSKKALQFYENAITVAPDKPEPYHSKAYFLQNSGKITDAINIYKEINVKHPDYIPSFLNTGILYMELDSADRAKEHFEIITQQHPKNPIGYYYSAQAELLKGNEEKAIQLAEDALALNPNYTEAKQLIEEISKMK